MIDLTNDMDLQQYYRDLDAEYDREVKQYYYDKLEGVLLWKMPHFSLDPSKIDDIIGRARKYPALIIDLRGNSGGRVDMLTRLIGDLFPDEVKIADEKRRKETKEIKTKARGKDAFTGKLIVLIDNGSASASEVFSRVIQLEKRGTIIGDSSAGAVMESMFYGHQIGLDVVVPFGISVTIADLVMKDGKSLEKVGVTPDIMIIPTGADLAAGRDPALAKAIEQLGLKITPDEAGKLFPAEEDDR